MPASSDAARVDLHTHSSLSDGRLSPEELVEEALWKGLSAIALTDHDSIDGNARAIAFGRARGLEVVPGVELSCEMGGRECHIVGLFVEPHARFLARLEDMRRHREERMRGMLERLNGLGIDLTMDDLPGAEGQAYGRPHLAVALKERGLVSSVNEAFGRYLGDDGPVNIPKDRFSFAEGLALIRDARGLSVLAHPDKSALMEDIPLLAREGLDAVEIHVPSCNETTRDALIETSKRYGLALSGGSDFHSPREGPSLGTPPIPYAVLASLKERKESVWPSVS